MSKLRPTKAPCKSCPYRKDVPAGIWHESEYRKLVEYDREMWLQPVALFFCHNEPENLCAGWFHCHGYESLALRMAMARDQLDPGAYGNKVPLFASGTEAAVHGMSGILDPDERAQRAVKRLVPKIAKRKRKGRKP